jgi:hypothetical protein
MTNAGRRANYEKQNGTTTLTDRQERPLRKAALKAEHHRPRTVIARPRTQRARFGRKRALAFWYRNAYKRYEKQQRQANRRFRLTRNTAPRHDILKVGPSEKAVERSERTRTAARAAGLHVE